MESHASTLGHRIRHFRLQKGLTLHEASTATGVAASQLSLIENGKREPRLTLLTTLAEAFDVTLNDLISPEPPDARSALEIELDRAQKNPLYSALGLPTVRPSKGTSTATLQALVGLHRELMRRAAESIATPEEARRANTALRENMRTKNNYIADIESLAEKSVHASGHTQGALTHREVRVMAEQLGFELIYVTDLPRSTRSITDLENGRIYLPPASIPGGHGLRSMALQAIAHRVLGHQRPTSYAEFLLQRLEINYFAACCLMPETAAVAFLDKAKKERDIAVEDFRDAFGVTHEAAALRFTNLATVHLGIPLHFLRVDADGTLYKGYENDNLPIPKDVTGSIEGQVVCRAWGSRAAFTHTNRTTELYQYTDTPSGTFWCATQVGSTGYDAFSISVGVPFEHAQWFRGRETTVRTTSRCPDEGCCTRPAAELATRWSDHAWPSARLHAHILAPLPSGSFPGVDDGDVYAFLESHSAS